MERELSLVTLSPLVLRADRSRIQFNPSLDYIPGGTLRGAFAAAYLQRFGSEEVFQRLLAEGGASFGDLHPSTQSAPGYPLPATAMACKAFRLAHRTSLTDSLLRLACAGALDDHRPIRESWETCPETRCGRKRDRIGAYCTATLEEVPVHRRVLAGTAIRRTTGTVEGSRLYSPEALEEGQVFRGVVRVASGAEALWARFEQAMAVGLRIQIGAAKTRGMGLVEIDAWREPPVGEPLDSCIAQFAEARRALWRQFGGDSGEDAAFSVTLTSHLLLRDRAGVPVTSLAGREDVTALFGLPGVRLGRHVLLPVTVKGWDARKGLPRADEPAIGRGSTLVFHGLAEAVNALPPRLAAIEAEGLGRRREEGFGRARVCDPFHYRFLPNELEGRR